MTLQKILARAVGEDIIMNGSNVVDFEDDGEKVTVVLENGQRYTGDLLVGADGIRSKVRTNLFGPSEATYSGYTFYTGVTDFVPADIEIVGFRVFLGHKHYFVSSDVGVGKIQWYAFLNEPAGGVDAPNGKKEKMLKIFGVWCDNVIDLLVATDEVGILRRDIYDRPPTFNWGRGRVTLLGDSVHAMQPNLGQGGCMAIEDSYQLALELDKAWTRSSESGSPVDIISSLRRYECARKLRDGVIHGLTRMAAIMASAYKAYLGIGLGPLSFLTKYRIPHPGIVGAKVFIDLGMPLILSWVIGGKGWLLLPPGNGTSALDAIVLSRYEDIPCTIGSVTHTNILGKSIVVPLPQVSEMHVRISCKDGAFFVTDLRSEHGTWVTE